MKTNKFKTNHMNTINKKHEKKLKLLNLKYLLVLIIIKRIFFLFRSHRMNNEILLNMKK